MCNMATRSGVTAALYFPESSRPARHRCSLARLRPARQQTRHRLAQLRLHHHGPEPRPGTPAGPDGHVVGVDAAVGADPKQIAHIRFYLFYL